MKVTKKHFSRSAISFFLSLCLMVSCFNVGLVQTDAAKTEDHSVGATNYTFYLAPSTDYYDKGSKTFKVNIKNTDGSNMEWKQSGDMTNTGRTYQGRPVYTVTMSLNYTKLYNLEFQGYDGDNQKLNKVVYAGDATDVTNYSGKIYDGTGMQTLSYDTFSLYNGTNNDASSNGKTGDFTYTSGSTYTLNATLYAGTTYSFFVYNASAAFGSKTYRCDNSTVYEQTHEENMYKYDNNIPDRVFKVKATVTGTYTITFTLAQGTTQDNEIDKSYVRYGNLKVTFPTTFTVSYSLGSNVTKGAVTGGIDDSNGTITAVSGSNVVLNVSYDTGYEFDSENSSIGTAATSNGNTTFTFSNISSNKTINIQAKKSKFNITVQADPVAGGTVSPAQFTNLSLNGGGTITATPTADTNYVFSTWEASPAENVVFGNSGSTTTTFTATGAATITARFTQETLYAVTVKADGSTVTTVNAGTTINPEITRVDRSEDDYEFTGWTLTGNVSLATGYSANNETIKVKATGEGGTVTANYTHVNYIYFYGALQANWNSNPVVTVDGNNVNAYAWIAQKDNTNLPAKTLYSGTDTNTEIGGNGCNTYYIGVYRVADSMVGKNINVFNDTQTGTGNNDGYCGTVRNDQGRCYYTYSTGVNQNHSGSIEPQKVTAVTTARSDYDGDETVTVNKTETVYANTKTAAQDDFTYTYELIDATTTAVVKTLGTDLAANTNLSFVPDEFNIPDGNYKIVIHTRDATTKRIHNFCTSGAFFIRETPTQSSVSFSGTNNTVSTHTYTYKNGAATSFNSGASLRAGSVVTLVYTINNGYTQGTTQKTGVSSVSESYDSSTSKLTITFTVPTGGASISITHTPQEITHIVHVIKRFYQSDGTTLISTDSTDTQTITGVGIATAKQVNAALAVADYTFKQFTLPSSGVTGTPNGSNAFAVTATTDATIYIDYKETLHKLTLLNQDSHGTITQSGFSTIISEIYVGNVTGVTLTATPNTGYEFSVWEKTTNASAVTIGNASNNSTTFRTSADATVTAKYNAVQFTITVSVDYPAGASAVSYEVGTSDPQTKTGGIIDEYFDLRITLNDGYALADTAVEFTNGMVGGNYYLPPTLLSGPTPALSDGYPESGNVVTYRYKMRAGHVQAVVHLKAKTPTLSNVTIRDKSHLTDDLSNCSTFANGATIQHYYKQPVEAMATTDNFSKLSFSNGTNFVTDKNSGEAITLEANAATIPVTENGWVEYTLTVAATNDPDGNGGIAAATTTQSFTVRVEFNDTQKEYFKLSKIIGNCSEEAATNNPYYSDAAAAIAEYNTAYSAAAQFYGNGYPAYNNTAGTNVYSTLKAKINTLMTKANMTTVYVLTNVEYTSTDTPVNITLSTNGNSTDWNHVNLYAVYEGLKEAGVTKKISSDFSNFAFHATYDGYVEDKTNRSTKYYLYTFSYAGRAKFQVWKGSTAVDADCDDNELTGVVEDANEIGKKYYVNLSNTNPPSTSVTTCDDWVDFSHERRNTGKQFMEISDKPQDAKTAADIKGLFDIYETGSVISAPGNIYTENTAFTVEGPIGKSNSATVNLLSNSFQPDKQGKYRVSYTTRFGKKTGNQNYYEATAVYYFNVAFDDVTVYVDMNENVGTPILIFQYKADANGAPVQTGGTDAYLPYEMDLVTGSESVYKYTVKTSKLRDEYYLSFNPTNPLKISYIMVENQKIGQNSGGFDITNDARISGEIWFKANSTHLTTFKTLAYGSALTSFVAVTEDANHTVLSGAVKSIRGTGIITDDDDIYHARYAAEDVTASLPSFSYVLKTAMNDETKNTNGTYYFDKWVKMATPADGLTLDADNRLVINNSGKTGIVIPANADYAFVSDISFTSALPYNDGDGDYTYIALYKLAQANDPTVRVELTYKFKDYDTSDGNYIFDETMDEHGRYTKVKNASYTKTVKVQTGTTEYSNIAAVRSAAATIAQANLPYIKSDYFDYSYRSAEVEEALEGDVNKVRVSVTLTEAAHPYRIVIVDADNQDAPVGMESGYYQQTVTLTLDALGLNKSYPVWMDSKGNVLAVGPSYTARFVASGFESNGYESTGNDDCQIIKVKSGTGEEATNYKSVVTNSTTTADNDGTNLVLHHNFYIVDYCSEGELIGGGVLFATTNANGEYRQSKAEQHLAGKESRESFIESILSSPYDVEYKAQTIDNVGFRYKPFNSHEDVFRYSDISQAYQTVYTGSNVNNETYRGQKLRLFSFMVYKTGNEYTVVSSEGYGEVDRYLEQG